MSRDISGYGLNLPPVDPALSCLRLGRRSAHCGRGPPWIEVSKSLLNLLSRNWALLEETDNMILSRRKTNNCRGDEDVWFSYNRSACSLRHKSDH